MSYLTLHKPFADPRTELRQCIYCEAMFTYNVLRETELASGRVGYECRSERNCEQRIRASWKRVPA